MGITAFLNCSWCCDHQQLPPATALCTTMQRPESAGPGEGHRGRLPLKKAGKGLGSRVLSDPVPLLARTSPVDHNEASRASRAWRRSQAEAHLRPEVLGLAGSRPGKEGAPSGTLSSLGARECGGRALQDQAGEDVNLPTVGQSFNRSIRQQAIIHAFPACCWVCSRSSWLLSLQESLSCAFLNQLAERSSCTWSLHVLRPVQGKIV